MDLKTVIAYTDDFPAPGILFRDLNPLWQEKEIFAQMIQQMKDLIQPLKPTQLVALEARGFIIASALAYSMGLGLSLIRKKGKLPGKTYTAGYQNEYTYTGDVEIQYNAIKPAARVVLIDDILATGKSTISCIEVLKNFSDITLLGSAYILEIKELKGREKLEQYLPVFSLIQD